MGRNEDTSDLFIALGSIVGFFGGLLVNPGGYTLIANIIIAGIGAGIGATAGMLLGGIVSHLRQGRQDDDSTRGSL